MLSLPSFCAAAIQSGGLIYAFRESTMEGKAVILLLVLGSAFSWTVMITKFDTVRRARAATKMFLAAFRATAHPLELFVGGRHFEASPLYDIYRAGCSELAYQSTGSTEIDDTFWERLRSSRKISTVAMGSVRSAMERTVGECALRLEDRMVLLATAVSGAPFLGLLGTVWGVMDTFAGVALAGSASLQAMAPGVSGALITTVTGLLVAIPAMFGYNFLVATIRGITVEMDNFAAELASSIEHQFLETRN
jgi:biopolymer transport protein ExbB/TolQ